MTTDSELVPMQIARHPSLTPHEKLELLQRLRAEVTGALENDLDTGLSPGEVDEAIEEVRLGVRNGGAEADEGER